MEGPRNLESLIRIRCKREGINMSDLKPGWRFDDLSVKSQIETRMIENGISVEDLIKGAENDYAYRAYRCGKFTEEEEKLRAAGPAFDIFAMWKYFHNLPHDADFDAVLKDIHNTNQQKQQLLPKEEDDPKKDGRPPLSESEKILEELMVRHNFHVPEDEPFRYRKVFDYIKGPGWCFKAGIYRPASGPVTIPDAGPEGEDPFQFENIMDKDTTKEDDEKYYKYLQELMPKNDPRKHIKGPKFIQAEAGYKGKQPLMG